MLARSFVLKACDMELYCVSVINKLGRRQRKHAGTNYLVLAESSEDARDRVTNHVLEYGDPLHISFGEFWGEGAPIALTHYSLTPTEVAVRIKRQPDGAVYPKADV